jgi:pilus assembly protein CpaE
MSKKILVVDDHRETLDLVTAILSNRGYQVVGAQSGKDGLILAETERPDLVVLDLMMPEVDGYYVCRQLRVDPKFASVPIIIFTAKSEVRDKLMAFQAGADDFLAKPTDPAELAQRIEVLLARGRGADAGDDPIPGDQHRLAAADKLGRGPAFAEPHRMRRWPGRPNRLITVVGARGGAGTTTVAINLAASLAASGRMVTLVDLDMAQGHVAMYLNHRPAGTLNDLAQLSGQTISQKWRQHVIQQDDNWSLLLSHDNLDDELPVLSPDQVALLLENIMQTGEWMVVDAGRGIGPAGKPALQRAGQVIVCVQPERVAILSARPLLASLFDMLLPGSQLHLLLVAIGMENRLPRKAVEGYLHAPLAATLSIDSYEMAQAVDRGRPIIDLAPDGQQARVFQALCEKVVWG